MQEEDEGVRTVPLSLSVEEEKQAVEYEENYDSGIKDATKERRIKARFESLDVVAAMGKSRKQRKLNQKIERRKRMTQSYRVTVSPKNTATLD